MHYVYILKSKKNNQYYIGSTANIAVRLREHNIGRVTSTRPHRPWVVFHTERYANRAAAMKRERRIKSWKSRTMIEKVVHP